MITNSSIEIEAPAATVWEVFTDVERWHEWTPSVTGIEALDGSGIAVGKRFRITQPKMPRLVWTVTEVLPGESFTWQQRSPGGTTVARHDVVAQGPSRTLVRQQLDQGGLLGGLVGRLTRRMTVRYLQLESDGLKARSEERARQRAQAG